MVHYERTAIAWTARGVSKSSMSIANRWPLVQGMMLTHREKLREATLHPADRSSTVAVVVGLFVAVLLGTAATAVAVAVVVRLLVAVVVPFSRLPHLGGCPHARRHVRVDVPSATALAAAIATTSVAVVVGLLMAVLLGTAAIATTSVAMVVGLLVAMVVGLLVAVAMLVRRLLLCHRLDRELAATLIGGRDCRLCRIQALRLHNHRVRVRPALRLGRDRDDLNGGRSECVRKALLTAAAVDPVHLQRHLHLCRLVGGAAAHIRVITLS
eukprot:CAMPEP_0119062668 /NCGR_PEP_ID=MMETSP1178-20130426/6198_1 /TAXON_ID=33656 /ORGANISM="unid sp, Strain CCMP2000" /LENGTH=268 /DNA_ID=CAMNT_0007043971 /DNA_START=61 /DNA_END=864 /DNA_ORIENTATION=+